MKARTILLLSFLAIVSCTNNDTPLPTLVPTAWIEATPLPASPLPATNTPPSQTPETATNEAIEAEAVLESIDLETCQEALATQSELEALQEQGQDVTELATAVAELIEELENCETLLTPTPLNE